MHPKNYLVISLNSLVYFLIAFLIIKNLTNLYSLLLAKASGYVGVLYYYGFTLNWESNALSNRNFILIYLVSFIVLLITGIVFERIYSRVRRYPYSFKMLFLWLYIIAISRFFGFVLVGAFYYYGIGVFFSGFGFGAISKFVIAGFSALVLFAIGIFSCSHIRMSANLYFKEMGQAKLSYFFFYQIILPVIIAFPLVLAYKYPHHHEYAYLDSMVYFSLVIFIAGMWVGKQYITPIDFKVSGNRFPINKSALVVLVLVILIFRLGLNWGVTI